MPPWVRENEKYINNDQTNCDFDIETTVEISSEIRGMTASRIKRYRTKRQNKHYPNKDKNVDRAKKRKLRRMNKVSTYSTKRGSSWNRKKREEGGLPAGTTNRHTVTKVNDKWKEKFGGEL